MNKPQPEPEDRMPEINPRWLEMVRTGVNACPYFSLQSMELVDLGPGSSHLEIDLQQKHLQPFGVVHGGVLASLVDAAAFWAVYSLLDDGLGMTTVEIKLNYLAPVSRGRLIGRGESIKLGRTLGLGQARVEDQKGRLLAHGTSTLMILPELKLAGQEQMPPKFI